MAELLGYVAPARKSQTSNSAGVMSPVLLGKAPKSPSTQEVYTKTGRHSAKAHRILRGNPAKEYHLIRGELAKVIHALKSGRKFGVVYCWACVKPSI